MPSLVAIRGPSEGKRYAISGACVIGRSFNSDVYVGDLNVSRRHAYVFGNGNGHYLIEDLGSGNGTFVNDFLVQQHVLKANDVIRVGGSAFRFEGDPPDQRLTPEVLTFLADVVEPDTGEFRLDPDTGKFTPKKTVAQKATGLDADRAARMLEAMYAVADVIAKELDLPRLLAKTLDHIFAVFPQAERGFVLLADAETGQLLPEAVRQRDGITDNGLTFSQTIVDQVMRRGEGVIRGHTIPPECTRPNTRPARLNHQKQQERILEQGATFRLEELPERHEIPKMGAPLICRGQPLGTLHVEGVAGSRSFSQEDLGLLSAIARQSAVAIANARASSALIAQQRMENDLQMARQIQESFLPRSLPRVPGLEFETYYSAAQHVGGDFYDIIQIRPHLFGILVGDVSGKGISAALLMARLTTAIRLYAQSDPEPASVMNHANRTLLETGQDAMFATVLFILMDLKARTFTVANAGHQPPMVCSHRFRGVSELDDATAVALGVVSEMEYPQEIYKLVPGDVVLLYTDGLNEAMNRDGKEYGMKRLRQVVSTGTAEPCLVVKRLVESVCGFSDGAKQSDDQTVVAFGMKVRDPTGPQKNLDNE